MRELPKMLKPRKAVSFFRLEGPALDALVMVLLTMAGLTLLRIYFFSN